MENETYVFKYSDYARVRVVVLGGEPWFFGYDIANLLGYNPKWLRKPLAYYCDNRKPLYPGRTDIKYADNIIIPMDDMTELCLRSTKLTDEVWHWVEKTLIPGAEKLARKNGKSNAEEQVTSKLSVPALTEFVTNIATKVVKKQLALAKAKEYPCIDDFEEYDGTITDDIALEELSKRMGYPILMNCDRHPVFHENVILAYQE